MKWVDYFLDRITMYRLLLYVLLAILGAAVVLSWRKVLPYNPLAVAFSAGYLTVICLVSNAIFAAVFEAPVSNESSYLTALILALIITPYHNPHDILFLTAAAGLAIASKYILAIRKKHLFNPAAVAVALTAAFAGQSASWWVGTSSLLPVVLVGGLLIIRKTQREALVISFFSSVFASTLLINLVTRQDVITNLQKTLVHSSLLFLAFIMLTEPQTSPTNKRWQISYGILVGLLFPPQVHILHTYSTPELALIAGNLFAYIVSPKYKLTPKLIMKEQVSPNSIDFVFEPGRKFKYKAGQYMEWTLPHEDVDNRGNRRYLTLASSPTEKNIRLGVKFYQNGSSYKKAMLKLDQHALFAGGQLGGDFVLPSDPEEKLVFVAGGIGITPFRSMVKYLVDTDQKRNVALLYSDKSKDNFIYQDVFDEAKQKLGMKTIYVVSGEDKDTTPKRVSANLIKDEVPDYLERTFYISGQYGMVTSVKKILQQLGVPALQIKTDFFPGYA